MNTGLGINLAFAALCGLVYASAAEVKTHYTTDPVAGNVRVQAVAISAAPGPYAKPILFIEGFDLDDGTGDEFDLEEFESRMSAAKAILLPKGYTMVLVDLETNWADLKANAKATGKLMQSVWNDSKKVEAIQVVGLSMGGLVGTLATRIKEFEIAAKSPSAADMAMYNGWNFKCNLALSYDTPNKGAYVPTGMRPFVDFFRGKRGGSAAEQPHRALTSMAASQMMLTRFWFGAAWNIRPQWQSYYDEYQAWLKPRKDVRLAGIVKGSWDGVRQYPAGSVGQRAVHMNYNPDACGHAIGSIWTQGRSDKLISKEWFAVCLSEAEDESQEQENYPNFENAPGGTLDGYRTLGDRLPGTVTVDYENFAFVPTFSAAALDYATFSPNSMDNFSQNETAMGPMENFSGMHKLYHHTGPNEMHHQIIARDIGWMQQEFLKAGKASKLGPAISLLLD